MRQEATTGGGHRVTTREQPAGAPWQCPEGVLTAFIRARVVLMRDRCGQSGVKRGQPACRGLRLLIKCCGGPGSPWTAPPSTHRVRSCLKRVAQVGGR
ncbi:hypothetical protein NDU88_007429 [Pleurodeles waltl]|uniref:Uncharacterized protein n=1 Tax=Pleurodeles waltl TaxID=8319 RepID=A0AAV7LS29_PLEWA|nr:hypothetical protein NDU88_007429 [Pleurodeles waltl]